MSSPIFADSLEDAMNLSFGPNMELYVSTKDAVWMLEDLDGDGWTVNQGDCDDCEPLINPGAIEIEGDDLEFQSYFTITNTADSGAGSLREAIDSVNSFGGSGLIDDERPVKAPRDLLDR